MDKMATRKLDDLSYAREMKRNALPLQKEVIWHFEYLRMNEYIFILQPVINTKSNN